MKRALICAVLVIFGVGAAHAQNIAGDWHGSLKVGGTELRLVLHISKGDDGNLKATLDSVDQGANGIPVNAIALKESKLSLTLDAIHASYEGKVNADASEIDGTWSQGQPLELNFTRGGIAVKPPPELRRPQNPVKPYPYRDEEVFYSNPAANIKLAATLTIPPGKGPFPAVLLITGSGPHDRDESLMGHRPFLVLADYLTRKGIVVLRADKRGVGKSTGSYAAATMADFASDAEAGFTYLKTRPEVDAHEIGLIGHSEGGIVAPMTAAHNAEIAFVVMMAGSGVPGDQIIPEQLRLMEEASGKSHDVAAKDAADEREILALVEKNKDDATLEKALREKLAGKVPEAQIGSQIKWVSSPWFRDFLQYDPASALSKVACPVLAINGEMDLQVTPQQNLPPIRKALEVSGNKNFEVDELPGLNHLFQTAKTGGLNEYSQIEETISPVALEKISSWILKQSATKPAVTLAR